MSYTILIKFIDLQNQYCLHKAAIDRRIQTVLNHSQYISGPEVTELEHTLAKFVGVKHCIVVDSGTVALQVAMMALGVGSGDEIITSPFSFFASASTIMQLGAKPIFVDIDPQTYNIDFTKIRAAITPKTKVIMPISLYGQCADFDEINDLAKQNNLFVIEDAAQSFGAQYKGHYSCSMTDIACTSFFPAKPLGCYGDGGACFTDDDQLAVKMRAIANHGQDGRYHHVMMGINGRCDTIQAAILLAKMEFFPKEILLRQKVAEYYQSYLKGKVSLPYIKPFNQSVFAQYTIAVKERDVIRQRLESQGIPTMIHYPQPIYKQPAYQNLYGHLDLVLPHAEHAAKSVLSLPFDPYLTEEEVNTVCTVLTHVIDNFELVDNL
jgi:UDP-2-acetamido-2-deoxy-ribo-hexuluronate aminotransferase